MGESDGCCVLMIAGDGALAAVEAEPTAAGPPPEKFAESDRLFVCTEGTADDAPGPSSTTLGEPDDTDGCAGSLESSVSFWDIVSENV